MARLTQLDDVIFPVEEHPVFVIETLAKPNADSKAAPPQRATMTPTQFTPGKADYPAALKARLGDRQLPRVTALGNLDHLNARLLSLFCSAKCPGNLILDTYDLARKLRDAGMTTIGGFHSPMEKECLDLLLRGKQPIVICPARGIQRMRTPRGWKPALDDGRLLVLSPFREADRRMTAALAIQRNEFVAAIADEILVAHAAPGSKTEAFCRTLLAEGRMVQTFDRKENTGLFDLGAKPTPHTKIISAYHNSREVE